nr:hypothetical protein [Tanacetum cinerariifolium]
NLKLFETKELPSIVSPLPDTKGLGKMLDQHHRGIHEQFSQILSEIESNETPKPDSPTFAITTRSETSTRDPPYPTLPESMTIDHAERTVRKEGPEVLEMDEGELVPIILGRPFLAIAWAVIDEDETVTFNIGKSMKSKHSRDDYLYCADHTAKLVRKQWVDTIDHDGK